MTDSASAPAFEVLQERSASGFGFRFKVLASGRVYKLVPDRCPRQPRHWCIWIRRCLADGRPDPETRAWLSDEGLSRDELPAKLAEIRADIGAWLDGIGDVAFHEWLYEPAPTPAG